MCGRYIIREQDAFAQYWRIHGWPRWKESFNVLPSDTVPVIRRAGAGRTAFETAAYGSAAPNECVLLRWGLIPFWSRGVPPKAPTFNARAERLQTAASFRGPWVRGQRCILPAAGFYESQAGTASGETFLIKLADREIFGLAGLWDRSVGSAGVIESCTIITLPARAAGKIPSSGGRLPVILREEDHHAWLSGDLREAHELLRPCAESLLQAQPVWP